MRSLLLTFVLLAVAYAAGDEPLTRQTSKNSELLEDTAKIAKELEEVEGVLHDAADGKLDNTSLKGLTEKIEKLAEQLTKPFKVSEGTKKETYNEYLALLKKVQVVLPDLKAIVQKIDRKAEDATAKFKVSDEKWEELWKEVAAARADVGAFVSGLVGSHDEEEGVPVMFSWNWMDSHIPGLRWIQKTMNIEIWRPMPDAESLQQELEKKVKSNVKMYGDRDLKIRIEKTGETVVHPDPAAAIKWLEQYKGKTHEDL